MYAMAQSTPGHKGSPELPRTPFPRTPEMPHVPGPIGPGPPAKGCPYRGEIMAYCACTSGSPDPGQLLRRQVGIGPGQRAKAGGARKGRFQESLATDVWNEPLQRTHPTGDGYRLTTEEPAQAKAAPRG